MSKLDDYKKNKNVNEDELMDDILAEEAGQNGYSEVEEYDGDFDPTTNDDEFEEKNNSAPYKHDQTLIEVEEKIISAILNEGKVPNDVNEHLFSDANLKEVFKGIQHFSDQDEDGKFDAVAVGHLIAKRRKNDKWKETIDDLIDITKYDTIKLENYLNILQEEHICLKATKIANAIRENVGKGNLDYIKKATTDLNNIELFKGSTYDSLDEALNTAIFELDEKINSDSATSGIPTGIPTLDETTGGLQKSDLIILAARPGQGKTAAAINFAYNGGVPCGFISSEMPSHQLALRLLSLDSGVNAQKIRNPKKLLPEEVLALKDSANRLRNEKEIYIDDKAGISIQEVREQVKTWKEKYDIQVLYIDYIQRLNYVAPGSDKMPRHEKIGLIAMEAKEIARDFDIAVVGLAQISRGAEKNEESGGRPMLSDLKDSGMIEQEADLVICPFRENTSGMDVNAVTPMEILLLKNRHGPLGEIDAVWIPKNMKIVEQATDHYESGKVEEIEEDEEEDIPY